MLNLTDPAPGEAINNALAPATLPVCDKLRTAADTIEALYAAVAQSERTFRRYEEIHRQKGTAEGNLKADNNRELADAMLTTLTKARQA